jgi:hypothetical protein
MLSVLVLKSQTHMIARLAVVLFSLLALSSAQAQVSPNRFSAVQLRELATPGSYQLSFIVLDPANRKEMARPSLTVTTAAPVKFEVVDPLSGNTLAVNIAVRTDRKSVDCSVEVRNGAIVLMKETTEIGLSRES